jgi:integrase
MIQQQMGDVMPKMKLTQRFIDNLEPSEKLILNFDTALTGFGVYTKGNAKTYFVQARAGKKLIKATIGKASVFTLEQARKEAKIKLGLMAKGIDPVAEKRKNDIEGISIQEAFKRFKLARTIKESTIENYDSLFRLYISDWLLKPIGNITRDMIAQRHKKVGNDAGEAAANALMRTFRSLYNFARSISEDSIPDNPVVRLSQTRQWYKVERRRTFLKPHELKPWYDAVSKIENPVIRDYILLTIFTGLRRQEGLALKWEYVDMKDRSLTLPPEITKNGRPHTLPLSNYLYDLFKRLETFRENDYVFMGSGKTGHLVEPKKQLHFIEIYTQLALNGVTSLDELEKKRKQNPDDIIPGINFCLHDLRRTFITVAESLDISYAALKRLLNHSDGNDVTGGYLQITTDRLREPMERISNRLLELMGAQVPQTQPD